MKATEKEESGPAQENTTLLEETHDE